jgi:hypothetical protein
VFSPHDRTYVLSVRSGSSWSGTALEETASYMSKTVALLSCFAITAAVLGGCSSTSSGDPFGAEPDYASIESRFSTPDGTFNASNAKSVFSRYADQRRTSQDVDVGGAAEIGGGQSTASTSSGLKSQALHLLDLAESGGVTTPRCSAIEHGDATGTCSCASGGSFTYDFSGIREAQQSQGPIDVSLKLKLDACAANDLRLDGREFVRVHVDRGGAGKIDPSSAAVLLVADISATKGAETHTIDLAARVASGSFEIALRVDDGWIAIKGSGSGDDGTFTIRDRDGSWTCNVAAGSGTCVGSNGDKTSF